jgi:hypothetical protein
MTTPLTPLEDDLSTATGASDPANAAIELAAHWDGPRCEKCDAPMKSDTVTVCRRCGWYPSLGQFIDVDQNWEVCDDEEASPAPSPSHLEVWANLLPWWAWVIIGTVAAVVAESGAVRLLTSEGSATRTWWSVTQLAIGVLVFCGCHLFNFLMIASEEPDCGALDLVLRPLGVWMRTFRKLPKRLVVTDGAVAGLTAALMSIFLIGGLPYDRLWDWGFKQPPKQNLLGAVTSQLQKVEGDGADNLEDAVQDFAGKQNLDQQNATPKSATPPPPTTIEVDCVILGYRVDSEGRLLGLLLGTAYRGKLVNACVVRPNPELPETQHIVELLSQVRSDRPYVPTHLAALWVRPIYGCRVVCEKQDQKTGRLLNASWKEFLGKLQ